MMFVEGFRSERESSATAHFQFLLNASKSSKGIHAFFEGHDDASFYMNFLLRFFLNPRDIYTYRCGNKKGVYETRSKVMNGFRQGIVLFFVDKDLSDILNENWEQAADIYTTDYYSIENYLVSEDMLFRIWTELFHFKNGIFELSTAHREKFQAELKRFYEYVLPMIAWAIYLRRNGMRPNVNNIKFSRFFDWDENLTLRKSEEVQQVGIFKLLGQICSVELSADWEADVEAVAKELTVLEPKTYIQGKLELCFFVRFVERLVKLLNNHIASKGSSVGIKTHLNEENAVEVLGPRLPIPQSLDKFLADNVSHLPR